MDFSQQMIWRGPALPAGVVVWCGVVLLVWAMERGTSYPDIDGSFEDLISLSKLAVYVGAFVGLGVGCVVLFPSVCASFCILAYRFGVRFEGTLCSFRD